MHPEVRTSAGRVRGTTEHGVSVFRGIPFAEPPVGALRFAAPHRARAWDGVRDALAFGPPPPQAGVFGMDALTQDAGDDWLTVNVWSPDPGPSAGLPVMVWIQGGAYTIGTASLPEYDGVRLARHGVVVVTFNYRVGIEGFGLVDGAPANRGLLDQVAALEWVRDNVNAFGGDPDLVTVFGQSAGGGSVAALFGMPRARGLFRRAVVQSAPGTFFTPELATDIAAACAAELGLKPTVADLSTVAPDLLPSAGDAVTADIARWAPRWGRAAPRSILFSPVVDGEVLVTTPWRALAEGAGREVDLLAGHTRDEQRLLTALDGQLGQITAEQAATALDTFAPDGGDRYREAFPSAEEQYEVVLSDWLFRMPTYHLAVAQEAAGGRAHLYELTWPAPGMGGVLGACHGLDVPLVFGNLTSGQPAALLDGSPEAEQVSTAMRTAWTAFATHGDPGWPAYDATRRLTRLFDAQPTVTTYPEDTSREIWRHHTFEPLPLEAPDSP
ncbi:MULTISPECIES: carboxylesterase/lipase family protein [unclassified Saccharothrix]|uniref:carboxylesterase/lipase family protein n=1 Tax=unclassified Saccharothrix TaxID=2593673 RepID=UPI00307CD228